LISLTRISGSTNKCIRTECHYSKGTADRLIEMGRCATGQFTKFKTCQGVQGDAGQNALGQSFPMASLLCGWNDLLIRRIALPYQVDLVRTNEAAAASRWGVGYSCIGSANDRSLIDGSEHQKHYPNTAFQHVVFTASEALLMSYGLSCRKDGRLCEALAPHEPPPRIRYCSELPRIELQEFTLPPG
jgi:hypothetical protein